MLFSRFALSWSTHPLYGVQMVCMHIPLLIKYACLVQEVDADFARSMDDLLIADDDADMSDGTVFVAEESKVARLGFLEEIY